MDNAKEDTQAAVSPVIEWPANPPEGLRERLKAKLLEYKGRVHLDGPIEEDFDALYKIAVLTVLFENGRVVTHELSRSLEKVHGVFNLELFENACAVIEDYLTANGRNVRHPSRSFEEIPV